MINYLTNIMWSMYFLIPIMIVSAIYFTIKFNFANYKAMFSSKTYKNLLKSDKKEINSLSTLALSVGTRIGTGNIVGTTMSILVAGPGSIFWMWVMCILGSIHAYVEATLSKMYSIKDEEIGIIGGAGYYIKYGLGYKKLAAFFSIILAFVYIPSNIALQSNVASNSVKALLGNGSYIFPLISAIILSILVYILIIKNNRKLFTFSTYVVSFSVLAYLLVTFYIIIMNFTQLDDALLLIVKEGLSLKAITGGTLGYVISTGIKRGIMSNESGMGTATYASASSEVETATEAGRTQVIGVIIDTIFISSSTAFIVLLSGLQIDSTADPLLFFQKALSVHLGSFAQILLIFMLFFLALTTIVGLTHYGKIAIKMVTNNKNIANLYVYIILLLILFSSFFGIQSIFDLGDFATAIMTLINLFALFKLRNKVFERFKEENN